MASPPNQYSDTADANLHAAEAASPFVDQEREILVSAIVSVYKAGKYIEGCLRDLVSQTIADRTEIILIDSASDEGEGHVIRSFQEKYKNIVYLRTAERETVYAAWNRGIRLATGKYITNANTDDRHRKDAFEVMAAALEQHPDVALVYADLLITETENQTFDKCTPTGRFGWLDWDRRKLLEGHCFMGPQPMWRRNLHQEYGYFRSDFITSGDYEFWLRISQTHDFMHLPVVLGLYLKTPTSIEHSNKEAQSRENIEILSKYQNAAEKGIVIHRNGTKETVSYLNLAMAYLKQGKKEQAFEIAKAGFLLEEPTTDHLVQMDKIIDAGVETSKSDSFFKAAIDLFPKNKALLYQYIGILLSQGRLEESLDYIEKGIVHFGHTDGILKHALCVRGEVGPLQVDNCGRQGEKRSLCLVLDGTMQDLAKRLYAAKEHADEIIAIDVGALEIDRQIAQVFGAQIYSFNLDPAIGDPWSLALQISKGDTKIRLSMDDSSFTCGQG